MHYFNNQYYLEDFPLVSKNKNTFVEWGVEQLGEELNAIQKRIIMEAADFKLINGVSLKQSFNSCDVVTTISSNKSFNVKDNSLHHDSIYSLIPYFSPFIEKVFNNINDERTEEIFFSLLKNNYSHNHSFKSGDEFINSKIYHLH